jgi:2-polyprenyl-3-methyl-5-hydroxy-6-metoxy-1,4-benzoquinol methylase
MLPTLAARGAPGQPGPPLACLVVNPYPQKVRSHKCARPASHRGAASAVSEAAVRTGKYVAVLVHHDGMAAFGGEVAEFYQRYRHGYPEAVIDLLAGAFGLTPADVVIDLGCGTGQLALPLARRVRAVLGVDPEPAMLGWAACWARGRSRR